MRLVTVLWTWWYFPSSQKLKLVYNKHTLPAPSHWIGAPVAFALLGPLTKQQISVWTKSFCSVEGAGNRAPSFGGFVSFARQRRLMGTGTLALFLYTTYLVCADKGQGSPAGPVASSSSCPQGPLQFWPFFFFPRLCGESGVGRMLGALSPIEAA